ncbi:HD domain-containing protein [Prevotella sp. P6B4]|uniref:HD domain-containing protein n=1 Tax=Prevotella sp. P6B4 TaxID=1410614 RepID=UPI000AC7E950|nr:HD domain-containing protein [Prevotella sp. P6B4]
MGKIHDIIDTQLVDRAIVYATKAHEGSVRKGTKLPFIVHPLEAMAIVATITSDQELMAAAVLHDVLEDTDVSVDEIRELFGQRVATLVDAETSRDVEGLSHVDSWQIRKQFAIDRLASASRDAQIVAIGDKLSNMRGMVIEHRRMGEGLWERFNVKDPALHAWYYRGLVKSLSPLSDTDAYREFVGLVVQIFGD